jgi:hypothetical protein
MKNFTPASLLLIILILNTACSQNTKVLSNYEKAIAVVAADEAGQIGLGRDIDNTIIPVNINCANRARLVLQFFDKDLKYSLTSDWAIGLLEQWIKATNHKGKYSRVPVGEYGLVAYGYPYATKEGFTKVQATHVAVYLKGPKNRYILAENSKSGAKNSAGKYIKDHRVRIIDDYRITEAAFAESGKIAIYIPRSQNFE